jgi:hypothetical protein
VIRAATAILVAALTLPAMAAELPSYAQPSGATADEQSIAGTIDGFSGRYGMTLRDDRGYVDRLQLHPGTLILPTGLRLEIGMHVTIRGHADGDVFDVDEIDAPDAYASPGYGSSMPYAEPVPYGFYGYPYGYYGYPYGYYPYYVPAPVYIVPNPVGPAPQPQPTTGHQWRRTLSAPPARSAAPRQRATTQRATAPQQRHATASGHSETNATRR